MRKICYVSGTRADFGLMQATLAAIDRHPALTLSTVVTGMHLLPEFGSTVADIERAGLPVTHRIKIDMTPASGATMARNIGHMVTRMTDAFADSAPDVVLLLGDRGEMLAAAIAALHLDIAVVHIHGGERSGTIDEPVRHAISKLSHLHLTATEEAAERLRRMGEAAANIVVTGAPGLDGLEALVCASRAELCRDAGLVPAMPLGLMVFHPVLQEAPSAGPDSACIIEALLARGVQIMALMPNADAGSDAVRAVLERYRGHAGVALATHLPRAQFVSWMAHADLMIGNSSAGIIEAASFGTPVINIGSRQGLRERNANVIDCAPEPGAIGLAVQQALDQGRQQRHNRYGDGQTAQRIVELLVQRPFDSAARVKINAY